MAITLLAAYTRIYSELPPFQQASQVEYALYDVGGQLRLVVCKAGKKRTAAVCELPAQPALQAGNLLRFLYENAVPVQSVCDIVQDLCAW